jgi:hypothetical protein
LFHLNWKHYRVETISVATVAGVAPGLRDRSRCCAIAALRRSSDSGAQTLSAFKNINNSQFAGADKKAYCLESGTDRRDAASSNLRHARRGNHA